MLYIILSLNLFGTCPAGILIPILPKRKQRLREIDLNENWSRSLENSLEFLRGSLGSCSYCWRKIINLSGPSAADLGLFCHLKGLRRFIIAFKLSRLKVPVQTVRGLWFYPQVAGTAFQTWIQNTLHIGWLVLQGKCPGKWGSSENSSGFFFSTLQLWKSS